MEMDAGRRWMVEELLGRIMKEGRCYELITHTLVVTGP